MISFTGIILAGGKSARLGANKAFLKVGGKPVIARIVDVLFGLCDEIIISANDPEPYSGFPGRVVPDVTCGAGALVGLYSSLSAAKTDFAFAAACDMPFLSGAFIDHMMNVNRDYDALVPISRGFLEPLHAIYSKRCLDAIQKQIEKGRKQLRSFFDDVNVKYVGDATVSKFSPTGLVFFNVNTPEDLEKARMIYSGRLVTQSETERIDNR